MLFKSIFQTVFELLYISLNVLEVNDFQTLYVFQAFMVGFVFAKMARPKQRTQTLLFSRYSVISLRDGNLCLMFRIGDMREKSHFISASVKAELVRPHATKEGEYITPFFSELKVSLKAL